MLKKVFCLIAFTTSVATSLFAQDCDTALEDALENFGQQRYNLIIALFKDCPPERLLDKTQKTMAYDLLAQAFFVNDQVDSSKTALNNLLDLQPGYAPQPPQYTEEFINTVEEVKDERARQIAKPILRNKWFWIGGVTASSVAAFFFFSKNQGSALLPEAPDPPGSP